MNYPAVDVAELEEHNSFDHSIGTDSGLAETVGNEFSEGLVSARRNSVAEKFARAELDLYKADLTNSRKCPFGAYVDCKANF